ncbi:M48 family metalloprotease [Hymenobacter busanensis]|uniref:M48 family metalloprotease n=1 Tax=Hymenobacter busanensis TaxID=2607656 RepID=A0A7L4ZUF5_9BACT|nr:M48 family metallopeptidase [Hymenobacter busanensis]KAA9339790.1 M48 family metalloprotease [Hymenobacter busanensis]QHJ06455.1 M48 family metalloprotease [Hymenobacter busanensis]
MRGNLRYIIGLLLAAFSLVTYYCNRSTNPVTGEVQHVSMSADQEIALGLQAAPEMAQQYGGLHPDQQAAAAVKRIGQEIVSRSEAAKSPYKFDFHLLADENTINAFALPGGQIFVTAGLLKNMKSEGQVAGVLAHEIGHVVGRHSAEQMAKSKLTQGLTGAAAIAAYDPDRPSTMATAAAAAMVSKLITMRFGRQDELEADRLAVKYASEAQYDPRSMIEVMRILEEQGGRSSTPEFMSTHPNPGNRIDELDREIAAEFPSGVPTGLKK